MLPEVTDCQIEPPNCGVTGRGEDAVINSTGGERIAEVLCSRAPLSPMDRCRLLPAETLIRAVVHVVAKYFPTSVISGRNRDKDPQNTEEKKLSVCKDKQNNISRNKSSKVTLQDIQVVQNLIERCLQLYHLYVNRDEVVNTLLDRTSIEPGFTNLEFFKAYHIRLTLKNTI